MIKYHELVKAIEDRSAAINNNASGVDAYLNNQTPSEIIINELEYFLSQLSQLER